MKKTNSILLVSYYCPTKAHAGGLRILDIYSLIKSRCPFVKIDLFTYHRPDIDWDIDDIYKIFDKVFLSEQEDLSLENYYKSVDGKPYYYDLVDIQFHQAAYNISNFREIGSEILFTPMESQAKSAFIFLKENVKKAARFRNFSGQIKLAYEEIKFCRSSDKTVCVSKSDADFISFFSGGRKVSFIETGLSSIEFSLALRKDYTFKPSIKKSINIVYVAYFGSRTNLDALSWYLQKVHPIVLKSIPDYCFNVVGRGDLSSFKSYENKNFRIIGEVSKLAPYIEQARLGIAPALSGSGFRGKINQYSILGIPTVASSISQKGLLYKHDKNLMVADSPSDFANCCIRLLNDADLNNRIATNARKLCLDSYTWESKWPIIKKIYSLSEI